MAGTAGVQGAALCERAYFRVSEAQHRQRSWEVQLCRTRAVSGGPV